MISKTRLALSFYVIITFMLCWVINTPMLIRAILILPVIIILPFMIGSKLILILSRSYDEKTDIDVIVKYFLSWCAGIILIIIIALIINLSGTFDMGIYLLVLLLILIGTNIKKPKHRVSKNIKKEIKITDLFLAFIFGLIVAFFVTKFSNFPFFYGSDMFRHNHNVLKILEGGVIPFEIPYLPTFHILVSIVSFLSNTQSNPFYIFWATRFITYPIYAIGIYLFSFSLSKNRKLSIISSLMGPFVFIEPNQPWNFLPGTIIYLILPFILLSVNRIKINFAIDDNNKIRNNQIKEVFREISLILLPLILTFLVINFSYYYFQKEVGVILIILFFCFSLFNSNMSFLGSKNLVLILIPLIASLMFHAAMGILVTGIVILMIFLIYEAKKSWISIIKYVLFLLLVILTILQITGTINLSIFSFYKDAPNSQFENISTKITNILNIPNLITFFVLMSLAICLFKKNRILNSILIIILAVLFVYFLPILDIDRIMFLLPPLIIYLTSDFINSVTNYINNKSKYIFIFLVISLIFLSSFNQIFLVIKPFYSRQEPHNNYALFTLEEYNAGIWLKDNIPENTIIISDSYTDSMWAGLSNKRKIDQLLRSNYYPDKYPQKYFVIGLIKGNNSKEAYEKINEIEHNIEFTCKEFYDIPKKCKQEENINFIVGITKKTFSWVGCKENCSILLDKFYDKEYFTEIYKNEKENIYIFWVNQEPGKKSTK